MLSGTRAKVTLLVEARNVDAALCCLVALTCVPLWPRAVTFYFYVIDEFKQITQGNNTTLTNNQLLVVVKVLLDSKLDP